MVTLLALLSVAAPLDGLVKQVIDTYGGEKALAAVRSVRETGTLESMRGRAKLLRAFTSPDKLRVQMDPGETRVLAGPHAFRDGEMVQGPPRDAMVLQMARLDLPWLLLRNRAKLVDLGMLERDGKKLHGIGIPLDGGLSVAIGVDPATGRIVHSEGALPMGVRFATQYSDFRKVKGVLFAFAEENFASGQHTGTTTLDKIELVDSLPDSTWRP